MYRSEARGSYDPATIVQQWRKPYPFLEDFFFFPYNHLVAKFSFLSTVSTL
jgi:hypothetical protein